MKIEDFVNTVQWASDVLITVDSVDLDGDFELLRNGEVVITGSLTTYSLGLILSEVARRLSEVK